MKILIVKKIGQTEFTFEVENEKVPQAFQEASKIDRSIPTICDFCQSTDLILTTNEAEAKGKKFIFVKIRCKKCSGYRKLGQNLEGGGWYFWDWAKFDPETEKETFIVREKNRTVER